VGVYLYEILNLDCLTLDFDRDKIVFTIEWNSYKNLIGRTFKKKSQKSVFFQNLFEKRFAYVYVKILEKKLT
jgi:hypothetical protein